MATILETRITHGNDVPSIRPSAPSTAGRGPIARTDAEEQSRESEATLRAMLDLTGVGMTQTDPVTRRFLRVNAAFCALTGYSEAELLAMTVDDLDHPDDREQDLSHSKELAQRAIPDYRVEKRLVRKDGSVVWVEAIGTMMRDADGHPPRIVSLIQDATERRETVAGIERARARLEALAEATRSLIEAGPSPETVLTVVARQAAALLGDLAVVRLLSTDGYWLEPAAVDHPDPGARDAARTALADERHPAAEGASGAALRTGRPQRLTGEALATERNGGSPHLWPPLPAAPTAALLAVPLRADGRVIGTLSVSRAAADQPYDAEDEHFLQELADRAGLAIARARLFAQVRASEARYHTLFEGLVEPAAVTDGDGRYLEVNPAMSQLLGYTRDELLGFQAGQTAVRWDVIPAESEHVKKEGTWRGETELRRKDGTIVAVEAWIRRLELPEGTVKIATLRDVTERKRAEEDRVTFLDALAHDIRNPLGAAKGQVDLALRRLRRGEWDPGSLEASLERATVAVDAATALIDELLDVAHLRAGLPLLLRPASVDLVALAARCADDVRRSRPLHDVRVETETPVLVGDWDQARLERVLANLLDNATKYSPDGGEIVVRVGRTEDAGGEWAVLTVSDPGIGIPADDLPYLFTRFRRGGNVGGIAGAGIGLAGALQIVQQHGGTIGAESIEGRGSTFTIRLPLPAGAGDSSGR